MVKGEHERALEDYMKALPILVKRSGEESMRVKNLRNWIIEAKRNIRENKECPANLNSG